MAMSVPITPNRHGSSPFVISMISPTSPPSSSSQRPTSFLIRAHPQTDASSVGWSRVPDGRAEKVAP